MWWTNNKFHTHTKLSGLHTFEAYSKLTEYAEIFLEICH